MAVPRRQIETEREAMNRVLAEELEAKIDEFLKNKWELHLNSVSMSISREVPNAVQIGLISRYREAGWDLKFESSTHYNEQDFSINISRYYG